MWIWEIWVKDVEFGWGKDCILINIECEGMWEISEYWKMWIIVELLD